MEKKAAQTISGPSASFCVCDHHPYHHHQYLNYLYPWHQFCSTLTTTFTITITSNVSTIIVTINSLTNTNTTYNSTNTIIFINLDSDSEFLFLCVFYKQVTGLSLDTLLFIFVLPVSCQ